MREGRWNVLHAIHDFLPRHRAGSEIYAFELCRALSVRHHVTVLCADYDPARRHGEVRWRVHAGLPVIEIVNNWQVASFADTFRPALIGNRIQHALRAVQPDIVHVHNLLNLSFELPAAAHALGIPVVATLHDYTLVCPSGGQRIHRADAHVCHLIEPDRCARCFRESPFYPQLALGTAAGALPVPRLVGRAAVAVRRRMPALAGRIARVASRATGMLVTPKDITDRLVAARAVFDEVDLFVAPSPSIASEFERLGLDPSKIRVSDYGFMVPPPQVRPAHNGPLRIGFAGTVAWHKGVHVLIDAVRALPARSYEVKIFGSLDTFPDYSASLRQQASGLPVRFMGGFEPAGAAAVYAQIDLLVVPSLWLENSPLVIHEAFMAGVPVVGSRIGGIVDLIEDGRNGLLYDATSAAGLTAALRRAMDEPGLLAAMANRLPAVKSIDDDAREWESTYTDVIGRRASRSRPE